MSWKRSGSGSGSACPRRRGAHRGAGRGRRGEGLGVDATSFPRIRMTVVTSQPWKAPALKENSNAVSSGFRAENLAAAKSVVLVDRSGRPANFADAVAAAQAFVQAKQREDRVAIATFATSPVMLTGFSAQPADAHSALGSLSVDAVEGTTLYDRIVKSARSFVGETNSGRVVIVVTDGNETRAPPRSSAIHAAREAGVLVYVVAIESRQFNPAPLRRLARDTGGSYRGAGSSGQLRSVTNRRRAPAHVARRVPDLREAATPSSSTLPCRGWGSRLSPAHDSRRSRRRGVGAVQAPAGDGVRRLPRHSGRGRARRSPRRFSPAPSCSPRSAALASRGDSRRTSGRPRRNGSRSGSGSRPPPAFSGQPSARLATGGTGSPSADCSNAATSRSAPWSSSISAAEPAGLRAGGGHPRPGHDDPRGDGRRRRRPWLVVYIKGKRRTAAFENQLPDLLITLAASLKAGHSFKTGLGPHRRRGQASREQGTEARAHRGPARTADRRFALRDGRAPRLEELRLRDHRGDDSAPGRRQPRRVDRHGRRHRSPATAVHPEDQGPDRDGTGRRLRARWPAVLHRSCDHGAHERLVQRIRCTTRPPVTS